MGINKKEQPENSTEPKKTSPISLAITKLFYSDRLTDIFKSIGTKGKILTLCKKHFLEITDQFLFVRSYLTYLFFVCSKIFLPNFLPIIHIYDIVFKFFNHFTIHNMLFGMLDCKIYISISLHVVFFHVFANQSISLSN